VTINSIKVKPDWRCMENPFSVLLNDREPGSLPQTFPTSGRNPRTYGGCAGILAELVHVPGVWLRKVLHGQPSELDRVQMRV